MSDMMCQFLILGHRQ